MPKSITIAAQFIGISVAASCLAAGDAEQGKAIYQARCSACHSVIYNGVGPAHKGVFERRIGQAPGYDYSPPLKAANGVWTAENLDRWLTDPEKFLPGQRMGFSLDNAQDRANVIEYLKSISDRE